MSYRGIGGGGYPYKASVRTGVAMNAVPPPPSTSSSGRRGFGSTSETGLSKHGYSTMDSISQFANTQQSLGKRKAHTEDEYFDDDDDQTPELAYIPAPGSPGAEAGNKDKKTHDDGDSNDSEDDPLDQFMAGIEQQVKRETIRAQKTETTAVSESKGSRCDIDDIDDEESYYRYMEENPMAGVREESPEVEIDYDEDGMPIAPPKNRIIDPLPAIDHSEIEYQKFEKNFYTEHEDIAALSATQVAELRHTLNVKASGPEPPKPVTSFAHFGFDEPLMKIIRKAEYTQPTPIQSQAIPAALGGRDIIGIAKTGSGKTAAFIWPMLVHIKHQHALRKSDGPIGLILTPTRELSLQIYNEAKKFGKAYNFNVICCYGGGSKWEQSKALEQGAEIVVATPGRMIDMIKMKATNLLRVTYLVLDEADRMFNMGFEPQVRSICNHVRPDRQTLLFSATFKKRIERLAREVLTDPVRIIQGDLGEANQDITQHVYLFKSEQQKWDWLQQHMVEFLSQGTILVFVTKKAEAESVLKSLVLQQYNGALLHGDMDQADRNKVISLFKRGKYDILVATDVAARGLDIPHIRTVINYDIARDIDTHTHRIGRTGRAGEKGTAYTLVMEKDKELVGHLVRNLEGAGQEVPQDLMDLAMKSSWFRKSRFKTNKTKNVNIGGMGLGYTEKKTRSDSPETTQTDAAIYKAKGGPVSNRYNAMREAFRAQYMSQFRASSDRTWVQTVPESGVFAAPAPPSSAPKSSPSSTQKDDTSKRAKKSRWN